MNDSSNSEINSEPISDFKDCHVGIISKLDMLAELPGLLVPINRAYEIAEKVLNSFPTAFLKHHADEERELFPLVLSNAHCGEERDQVEAMVERLTREHREIEASWKKLDPGLKRLSKGDSSELDEVDINQLVANYRSHARFEEEEFLPLSFVILSRNSSQMSALAWALHMRHLPESRVGYI